MTGSWSFSQVPASVGLRNFGWSTGGMPSRGGPPDSISDSGIRAWAKLVFQPRVVKRTPDSATAVGTAAGVRAAVAVAGGADLEIGFSASGGAPAPTQAAKKMRTASPR